MNGMIMGGGCNSRLPGVREKLTLPFGIPMILRVVAALKGCPRITSICVATSPHAPQTRCILKDRVRMLETAGAGYSKDMTSALTEMSGPTLIVPGDMPLLDSAVISDILHHYDDNTWTTVLTSESLARLLGASRGVNVAYRRRLCRYTGISMVNATQALSVPQRHIIQDDIRLVVNVNSIRDCVLLGAAHHAPIH